MVDFPLTLVVEVWKMGDGILKARSGSKGVKFAVGLRFYTAVHWKQRTLTQKDQLELVMSNSDVITYDVYSITQMSIEDMQKVSSNSPCLLLVLADANTDTRLVVTAYPH